MPRSASQLFRLAPLALLSALAGAQDSRQVQVDSIFATYSRGVGPGVAVAVVRNDSVLLSKGYGYADLEHGVPITSASVFDVASVSKQFTGLAIAMLVEQGRFALTDEIRKYIPELPDFGRRITIDHLLHHTSGLRDWPGTLALAGWRMDDVISFDQILTMAFNQRALNFEPGSEYTYSNTGYNLLAELVRRVTGQSFRAWTDEHLFRPLGMGSSHFRDDHTEVIPNRVFGYARAQDGTYRATGNNLAALGSSSLFSTVDDLAKWVINLDDPRVGGRSAMQLAHTRGVLTDGSPNNYAFGISHGQYRGLSTLSHGGGWASFSSFVLHFPDERFGVVVLANTTINASGAAYRIADTYLDSVMAPRAAAAAAAAAAAVPGPVPVDREILDRYTGLYRLGPGWYARITLEGDSLMTQASRERAFPMTARSDSTFWVAGYNAAMLFRSAGPERQSTEVVYRGRSYPRVADSPRSSAEELAGFAGTYESVELATTYQVEVQGTSLVMRQRRHGTIALTRLWRDDFTGSVSFLRSVEFQRDPAGKVTGFLVLVDERSRNIRFVRRD